MLIRARAPLRLGLAGGGTDIAAYADVHGGYVLNATIDRYAYTVLKTRDDASVRFCSTDHQSEVTLPLAARFELDGQFNLHKAVYNEVIGSHNGGKAIALEMSTFCDAPAGSGLGSSSTLVVSMIKAFVELLNLPLDDYTIAQMAYKVERIDCNLQGGQQDQYSAAFGGFNFMEFHGGGRVIVNPLRVKHWIICELEACLVLYYTGVSRESARIIADQNIGIESKAPVPMEAMHGLKREAITMKECVLKGDFAGIVESMRAGWESKKRSARTVSNPLIDDIYESALRAGALAGKVSGAGGGGFMMFYVPPDRRMDLIRTLEKFDGEVSNCSFTKQGMQAWRL